MRLIVFTLLGVALIGAGAYAAAPTPVKVERCGYAEAAYGRSALYPWHMSCAAARKVVAGSDNPHAHVIGFGPGWDGEWPAKVRRSRPVARSQSLSVLSPEPDSA